MSYSISKTNYFVNASSFGNNRTQRTSINFGIYEPSNEASGTEPSLPTRALEGPQVVFGEATSTTGSGRIVTPSESNILQPTGIPQDSSSATTGGARIVLPSESNILQSTSIQQTQNSTTDAVPELPLQDSIVDALTYFSPAKRRTRATSVFASTASGRNRN